MWVHGVLIGDRDVYRMERGLIELTNAERPRHLERIHVPYHPFRHVRSFSSVRHLGQMDELTETEETLKYKVGEGVQHRDKVAVQRMRKSGESSEAAQQTYGEQRRSKQGESGGGRAVAIGM